MRLHLFYSFLLVQVARSVRHTAVVTNHPECAAVARSLINSPITHIFVAVALCEGIVNPQDSGIGGGFQAIIRKADGKSYHVDAREHSPSDDAFLSAPLLFGNSVGVPSACHGYATILGLTKCARRNDTHGDCLRKVISDSMYAKIFDENVKLACHGFHASKVMRDIIAFLPVLRGVLAYDEKSGMVRNPSLCSLLRWLSESPANLLRPYYALRDNVRSSMIQDTRTFGGHLRDSDFLTYTTSVKRLSEINLAPYFPEFNAIVPGQPSAGLSVLYFLLQRNMNYTYASLVRALRDTVSTRLYFREFPPNPAKVSRLVVAQNHLYNAKFNARAHGVRRTFRRETYPKIRVRTSATQNSSKYGSTTNVVIIRNKEAIVATSSINHLFGSTVLSKRLGIPYNNQLRDFVPNSWRIGNESSRRTARTSSVPPSSMSPVILTDSMTGEVMLGIGGTGGQKILPAVCGVLWHVLYGRKNIREAIQEKRMLVNMRAKENVSHVLVEVGDDRLLSWVNHNVFPWDNIFVSPESGYSSVTAASNFSGQCMAEFDPRRGGASFCY